VLQLAYGISARQFARQFNVETGARKSARRCVCLDKSSPAAQ